jgi:signal transduction histidine kinase
METAEVLETPANLSVRDSRATRSCGGTNKAGESCRSVAVGADGFCSLHSPTRRVDPAQLGRRGGIASGKARREQARRVREGVEQSRVQAEVDTLRLKRNELEQDQRESRRRFDRDLRERRERFIAAAREELREKLSAERAELRRLRRRRKHFEAT